MTGMNENDNSDAEIGAMIALKRSSNGCLRSPYALVTKLPPNFPGTWSIYRRVSWGGGGSVCANMLQPRSTLRKSTKRQPSYFGFTEKGLGRPADLHETPI